MSVQILGSYIVLGDTTSQIADPNQVIQGIAGRVQRTQFAYFLATDIFANNLTELQSADARLTETGFVDEFVFDNTTYDYGGWEVTRIMINNTSSEARLYVVYTYEWANGVVFAIFRTVDNQLTDTSIGYPSFSTSTGQTSGTPSSDHTYELVYSWTK